MVKNSLELKVEERGEGDFARVFFELHGENLNLNFYNEQVCRVNEIEKCLSEILSHYCGCAVFISEECFDVSEKVRYVTSSYLEKYNDELA